VAVRPTRRGNRQLDTAIHRIAVVQIRMDGAGDSTISDGSPTATRDRGRYACSNVSCAGWCSNRCAPTDSYDHRRGRRDDPVIEAPEIVHEARRG
jgi:hypothetical protein